MNIIGPKQHCEKYLPMTIRNIMSGQRVKIHTNRNGEIGSRHWLHARTQANAILFLLENGEVGNTYHIGGERMTNLKMAVDVAEILGETLFHEFVNAYDQYPGHDLHYGINDDKIKSLGWTPKLDFKKSLTETVKWYFEHPEWLEL
jgi:dTDP-D-glucose 4,6-dehydratase